MPPTARRYFYEIDRRGELWHNGTVLTDATFLRQFFHHLRDDADAAVLDYPFVSACAGELNYVRAEVTPVVFRRLVDGSLVGNGGLVVPFAARSLRVDRDGMLYHRAPVGGFGLLLPAVLADLAPQLDIRHGTYVFADGTRTRPIAALGALDRRLTTRRQPDPRPPEGPRSRGAG